MLLARVAIPVPLGQMFTYRVDESHREQCQPGARVLCEFGRRPAVGVVVDVADREPEIEANKLKPIVRIVDSEPVIPVELLSFLVELARYYLAPMGEVMRLALPAVERKAADDEQLSLIKTKRVGRVVKEVRIGPAVGLPVEGIVGKTLEVYEYIKSEENVPLSVLNKKWSTAARAIEKLRTLGLVTIETTTKHVDPFTSLHIERDQAPTLNAYQQNAVDAINREIEQGTSQGFLLHGVTASGKTEVYIHAVGRCLELGKSALVLVPEIALTPQLVARFRARLGEKIAVLHSALSDAERHVMWKRLRSGELRVAIGARSALFAPVMDLGLLCVDEEHDSSFKQEEGVRYHARDMAILRAYRAKAVCVLGSATPSLATIHLAEHGQLKKLHLPGRARETAGLPEVEIVDLRRMGRGPTGDRLVTLPLQRAIESTLVAKEQVILFLNRRGFAPSLICDDCGTIANCPDCSVALTVHRSYKPKVVCHYCGFTKDVPERCEACKSSRMSEEGSGTERIEEILKQRFPTANVARLDRDVAAGAKSEQVLSRMRRGEIDILVGTQMVTKGHDLPEVTLVGVLDADAALSLPDFRAAERTFQLLVQVAGRAGRASKPGRVLVQTRQPDAPAIAFAMSHNVEGFLAQERLAREELEYPPYSRLGLVRCEGLNESVTKAACEQLARVARSNRTESVDVVGPSAAPIAKVRNRYRFRFLIKSKERKPLRQTLLSILRTHVDRRVHVIVDVDPMSML
jgi:primosomal protein N' (replication factor Y)